jgi:hypothetical protein
MTHVRDTVQLIRLALRAFAVALLCGALSGCGAVKIAYDHGETFAMFWLGRYIDLDASQEDLARERIRAFIYWHRKNELPDYVNLAENLRGEALKGITTADQQNIETALRERGYRALNRGLGDLADLALALRPEQLDKTREKFADNDRQFREDFVDVSADKSKRDRADKWQDRIEYWYGDLNAEQRATLRDLSASQPYDARMALAERQSREREFVDLLTHIARDKPARGEAILQLAAFARRCETSPDAKRRAYLEAMHQSNAAIWVRMSNLATAEQRRHADQKLGEWIDDMKAAQAG